MDRFLCDAMRRFFLSAAVAGLAFFAFAGDLRAATPPKGAEPEKILIAADRLISDNQSRYAEFIGNVRASQGQTVIYAEKLKVFYTGGMENREKTASGENSIQRIVANGNVKIHFDNRIAEADEAEYVTQTRVLTLTGGNTRVTEGKNTISGSKIVLDRTDGRITVESSGDRRVQAVFFPAEKGIE